MLNRKKNIFWNRAGCDVSVSIYGFGSAFAGVADPDDVDLLIVHPGMDLASCELAIACKRRLVKHIVGAHVTMLSASEVEHFQFTRTARALHLGTVRTVQLEEDLAAVLARFARHQAFHELPLKA